MSELARESTALHALGSRKIVHMYTAFCSAREELCLHVRCVLALHSLGSAVAPAFCHRF
jgi:hypothetical protein